MNKLRALTSCIKHLADSGLSSGTARIKSSCNLTGLCFEIGNKNIPPNRYAPYYEDATILHDNTNLTVLLDSSKD